MTSSSYQQNFDKIHKKIKSVLLRMHFEIIDEDIENGLIIGKREVNLFKSAIMIEIRIKKIDDYSTQIFINAEVYKNWFKVSEKRLHNIEGGILSSLS